MPTFTKSSDTAHKIQLESRLIYAIWSQSRAHAGQEAGFEVRTSLVGDGAQIKITCFTDNGKKLEKTEGTVFNNRCKSTLLLPENVKPDDMIYFEAELPKHRLKGESNSIPVRPAIQVTSIQWDRQEVKREDVVTLTCQFQSGVVDDDKAFVVIYEHNPNSCDFKVVTIPTTIKNNKVEIQWEFDYQDSTKEIPTDAEMQPYQKGYENPEFFFMVVVDGIRIGENRESGLMKFRDVFNLTLKNIRKEPLANREYVLHFADGSQRKGLLNQDGHSSEVNIPPGKIKIELQQKK